MESGIEADLAVGQLAATRHLASDESRQRPSRRHDRAQLRQHAPVVGRDKDGRTGRTAQERRDEREVGRDADGKLLVGAAQVDAEDGLVGVEVARPEGLRLAQVLLSWPQRQRPHQLDPLRALPSRLRPRLGVVGILLPSARAASAIEPEQSRR